MERHVEKLLIHSFPKLYLTPSQPNTPDETYYHFQKPYYWLAILSLVYGGILATALTEYIPTTAERMIWSVCVCVIGIGGFMIWGLLAVFFRGGEVVKDLTGLLIGVFTIVWSVARVFLIVEAI